MGIGVKRMQPDRHPTMTDRKGGAYAFQPIEMDEVYCVAYGSNLCEARMKQRCPEAEIFGFSQIPGYRLLFKQSLTGAYATIEQDANRCVPVLIYRMTPADEARLDRFEGVPTYYRKQFFQLPVWGLTGRKKRKTRCCVAYIMRESRLLGEPSQAYFSLLDEGYRRWGFDRELLLTALNDSLGSHKTDIWLRNYMEEGVL